MTKGQLSILVLTEVQMQELFDRALARAIDTFRRTSIADTAMLSPRQVARVAKICDLRVYQDIKNGRLAHVRSASGRFHIKPEDARNWILSLEKYRQ